MKKEVTITWWDKNYGRFLGFMGTLGSLVIIKLGVLENARYLDEVTPIIFFLSGIAIIWYAQETVELKKATIQHTQEIARQAEIDRLLVFEREWTEKYIVTDLSVSNNVTSYVNFFEILAQAYLRDMIDKEMTMKFFAICIIDSWSKVEPVIKATQRVNPYSFIDFQKLHAQALVFIANNTPDSI